jgi:hypothetical protein
VTAFSPPPPLKVGAEATAQPLAVAWTTRGCPLPDVPTAQQSVVETQLMAASWASFVFAGAGTDVQAKTPTPEPPLALPQPAKTPSDARPITAILGRCILVPLPDQKVFCTTSSADAADRRYPRAE